MTELRRDCLFDLGMGRDVPNEFLEDRLSFIDGEMERLCMYGDTSACGDRVAGISTEPGWSRPGDEGIGIILVPLSWESTWCKRLSLSWDATC